MAPLAAPVHEQFYSAAETHHTKQVLLSPTPPFLSDLNASGSKPVFVLFLAALKLATFSHILP